MASRMNESCSDLDTHRCAASCNRCANFVVPASTPFAMAPGLPDQLPASVSHRLHKQLYVRSRAPLRDGNVQHVCEHAVGFTFRVDRCTPTAVTVQAAFLAQSLEPTGILLYHRMRSSQCSCDF